MQKTLESRPEAATDEPATFEVVVQDGLTLRGRHYKAQHAGDGPARRPALCLAGLTRNGRDFTALAEVLSQGQTARDVYTLDMRGRGASDFATDWKTYTVMTELNDVLDVMTVLSLHDVALIGTSRGGLIGFGLAAVQPTRLGVLVLNDIGPIIEPTGLSRIGAYVGATPTPATWDEAVDLLKRANRAHFPHVTDDEWLAQARQWFNERDGRPAPGYDAAIAKTFELQKDGIPELWPQFHAVTRIPCLAIRGLNSDLFSEETLVEMGERHPRLRAHRVPDQGHAPLLTDTPTQQAIADFLVDTD